MPKILELREKRAALVAQARQILDKAEAEKRSLNAEDNQQYDRIMKEVDELKGSIDKEERMAQLEGEMRASGPSSAQNPGAQPGGESRSDNYRDQKEYREAFYKAIRRGLGAGPEVLRSLNVGSDPQGGLFVPTTFESSLREKLENANVMRGMCNVITSSTDREIPFEEDYGQAYWTGEEKAAQESDASMSKKALTSHKLTALIKVSDELLMDGAFNVEAYIASAFARRFGRKEELGFISGTGQGQPRGFLNDASAGKTAASATAITSDELLEFYHSLARYYRANARFLMADSTALAIRKLKNAVDGTYLWQPGLQAGQPDVLLGKPVMISDDMPAITNSAKAIAFGDFNEYQIVDRMMTSIQRLNELYAVNGQVGFLGRKRTDGRLLRTDAIKLFVMKA